MRPLALAVVVALALAPSGCRAPEPTRVPRSPVTRDGWTTPAASAPGLEQRRFASAVAGTEVTYHVWLPPGYGDEPDRRYPTLYWLHGSGGGDAGLVPLARLFAGWVRSGELPPLVVIFPNGMPQSMWCDAADGHLPMETVVIRELVPHVDATLRTIATREGRVVEGFSMGGYGAARFGFRFPELFRAVSIMGGGPLQAELAEAPRAGRRRAAEVLERVYGGDQAFFRAVGPRALAEANAEAIADGSLVRVVVGDRDDTFANNRDFHEHLARLGIPHDWTVLPGVGHDPAAVLDALGADAWAFHRAAFATAAPDPAGAAGDVEVRLTVQDRQRRAVVVNAAPADVRRPAVIVLHGGMGSAARMRAGSGFDRVARAHGFMVAYGEGTEYGGGRHAWNTGFLLRRRVRDADDVAYLDALLDALVADHGADPGRIFMTGASNGGMMTFVYAVSRAERLAGIAPVVATMFSFDTAPAVPVPALIVNGGADGEVPLEGGMSRNPLVRAAQGRWPRPSTSGSRPIAPSQKPVLS